MIPLRRPFKVQSLLVGGLSNKIYLYQNNGSQYLQHQIIQTQESNIYEIFVYQDMSGFAFGRDSKTLSIYGATGEGYKLIHSR